MSGAYSPVIASVAGLVVCSVVADLPLFERYPTLNLIGTMHGAQLLISQGESLAAVVAPLPWLSLGAYALVALCLIVAAGAIMARRDFS